MMPCLSVVGDVWEDLRASIFSRTIWRRIPQDHNLNSVFVRYFYFTLLFSLITSFHMFSFLLSFRRHPFLWDSGMEMPASRVDKIQVCTVNIANTLTKRRWRNCQSSRKTDRQRFRWAHCTACRNTDEMCRKHTHEPVDTKIRKKQCVCVQTSVCITRFEGSERRQVRPAVGDSKQENLQQCWQGYVPYCTDNEPTVRQGNKQRFA